MDSQKIDAAKITKPIQLLAVWLIGLILIDSSFLVAAVELSGVSWASSLLTIAAVINVPLFLVCIFLLQTKFRPEMQEDRYYSEYLSSLHKEKAQADVTPIDFEKQGKDVAKAIVKEIGSKPNARKKDLSRVESILSDAKVERLVARASNWRALSELYILPERWPLLVAKWGEGVDMKREVSEMELEGLVKTTNGDLLTCELTPLGKRVAEIAKSKEMLWNQKYPQRNSNDNI